MKQLSGFVLCLLASACLQAQELYIFTDPASNVPAKALSMRVNNMLMPMNNFMGGSGETQNAFRLGLDASYGLHKNLMVKLSAYGSDMFQSSFSGEAATLYAKYRFLSNDDFHKHFRMAGFGKLAWSNNPAAMSMEVVHTLPGGGTHVVKMSHAADELNLEGNHSGWQAGVVATQLVHKLAVSATGSVVQRLGQKNEAGINPARSAVQYTLSAGYLLFPRSYESYGQTNLNLYAELIGQSLTDKPGSYLDFAPALQLILNSKARIDMAYRFQIGGNMSRFNEKLWLLRFEYNFLQAFARAEPASNQ